MQAESLASGAAIVTALSCSLFARLSRSSLLSQEGKTMECFSDSYAQARGKFLVACADAGARVTTYSRESLLGEIGELLATDVACLGPEAAQRAAIVICGTRLGSFFWLGDPDPMAVKPQ